MSKLALSVLYKTCQCTHGIFNDGNVIWHGTAVKASQIKTSDQTAKILFKIYSQ